MKQVKKQTTNTNNYMEIRRLPFEFSSNIDPHWHKQRPEWSHMVNGASLSMPFLEPYLIKTMRKANQLIDSKKLNQEVSLYIGQEGQHFQQHRKFNDRLIEYGYSELVDIENEMKQTFGHFETNRSLKFNLAYAAGFETMALGIGHWLIKDKDYLFGGSDTKVASLILWHFVEEIEHKCVAIDAYNHLYGNYFYRVFGMIYATAHVIKLSQKSYKVMLKKDGLWRNMESRWRLMKMIIRFYKNMIPSFLEACLPNHHPSKISDPEWSLQWINQYNLDGKKLTLLNTENLNEF
ncbi:metal-dependent hydrolase [Shewanella phaeophyticola]|uniref:Metal-dependent hydrolase n=1 Tax=Shewanella phaeophyticola TaxID=2978345 RepID=A0ABT2P586_9GAMM|nr:metal-dependent hydrolase [Shewanella sp. KJ10-1]MCT8987622.1 metal-dependent hydrolase [Shewanella sp. KJ10-1]